jgi:hypothetical protein
MICRIFFGKLPYFSKYDATSINFDQQIGIKASYLFGCEILELVEDVGKIWILEILEKYQECSLLVTGVDCSINIEKV